MLLGVPVLGCSGSRVVAEQGAHLSNRDQSEEIQNPCLSLKKQIIFINPVS